MQGNQARQSSKAYMTVESRTRRTFQMTVSKTFLKFSNFCSNCHRWFRNERKTELCCCLFFVFAVSRFIFESNGCKNPRRCRFLNKKQKRNVLCFRQFHFLQFAGQLLSSKLQELKLSKFCNLFILATAFEKKKVTNTDLGN